MPLGLRRFIDRIMSKVITGFWILMQSRNRGWGS